jgi:hypothetical protein
LVTPLPACTTPAGAGTSVAYGPCDVTTDSAPARACRATLEAPIGRLDRWEGVMVPVALIIFFGLFALSIVALVVSRSASLDYEAKRTWLHQPGVETLSYDLPAGQDAAAVIVALGRAGYTAVEDTAGSSHQVLVSCPEGRLGARSRVRAAIEKAGEPEYAHVRFADER